MPWTNKPPVTTPVAATDAELYDWLAEFWFAARERVEVTTGSTHWPPPDQLEWANGAVASVTSNSDGTVTFGFTGVDWSGVCAGASQRWVGYLCSDPCLKFIPGDYDLVVCTDLKDTRTAVRGPITAQTYDDAAHTGTLTIGGNGPRDAVTAKFIASLSSLVGAEYAIVRRGDRVTDRFPPKPNDNELWIGSGAYTTGVYPGDTGSAVGTTYGIITETTTPDLVAGDRWKTPKTDALVGHDLLIYGGGLLRRYAVLHNAGRKWYVAPVTGYAPAGAYVVVASGGKAMPGREIWRPFRWCSGYGDEWMSHAPDDSLQVATRAATRAKWQDGDGCHDPVTCEDNFFNCKDHDVNIDPESTCEPNRAGAYIQKNYWWSIRALQVFLAGHPTDATVPSGLCTAFVKNQSYVGASSVPAYTLTSYADDINGQSYFARFRPRLLKYWYGKTVFIPDLVTDVYGTRHVADPPAVQLSQTLNDDGTVTTGTTYDCSGAGRWIARAASSGGALYDDYGALDDNAEDFVAGDLYRADGDNWGDSTITPLLKFGDPLAPYYDRFYRGTYARALQSRRDASRGGIATAGTHYSFTDATKDWWSDGVNGGVLRSESGTATLGGSGTTLTDAAKDTTDNTKPYGCWWAPARFVGFASPYAGFVAEITHAGTTWRVPIASTTQGSGGVVLTVAAVTGLPDGTTVSYRVREPAYELDKWAGRTLTLTDPTTGATHAVAVTHSDDATLYFAPQSFAVAAGWSGRIEERGYGGVWQRGASDFTEKTGGPDVVRVGVTVPADFHENSKENLPTYVKEYGPMRCGDAITLTLFAELQRAIQLLSMRKFTGGWTVRDYQSLDADGNPVPQSTWFGKAWNILGWNLVDPTGDFADCGATPYAYSTYTGPTTDYANDANYQTNYLGFGPGEESGELQNEPSDVSGTLPPRSVTLINVELNNLSGCGSGPIPGHPAWGYAFTPNGPVRTSGYYDGTVYSAGDASGLPVYLYVQGQSVGNTFGPPTNNPSANQFEGYFGTFDDGGDNVQDGTYTLWDTETIDGTNSWQSAKFGNADIPYPPPPPFQLPTETRTGTNTDPTGNSIWLGSGYQIADSLALVDFTAKFEYP